MTKHLVLLGDSIFDNANYVPGEEPVVEQLREALEGEWMVTLLAVDGHKTSDVATQLDDLPHDATHLIVSVGGNDALQQGSVVEDLHGTVAAAIRELADVHAVFRTRYRDMLEQVVACGRATTVCTIYDQIPLPDLHLLPDLHVRQLVVAALSIFNGSIIREACRFKVPVLDLREVCQESTDFSALSPIEPSCLGGLKIAYAIARLIRTHSFVGQRTIIYP